MKDFGDTLCRFSHNIIACHRQTGGRNCFPISRASRCILEWLRTLNKKPSCRWDSRPYCITGNHL